MTGHPVRNKVEIWLVFLQHQTIRGPGKMEGEGDNKSHKNMFESNSKNHQEFQVPQMEVGKNLMFGYFGGGFSLSRIHTAYIGFWIPPVYSRYLKCLVKKGSGKLDSLADYQF